MAEEEENYYAEFDCQKMALCPDNTTLGGQVLCQDLSAQSLPKTLIQAEKDARGAWNATRANIIKYYKRKVRKVVDTKNIFLEERVLPPPYTVDDATTRKKAGTRNPRPSDKILAWHDFEANAAGFSPVDGDTRFDASIDPEDLNAFKLSMQRKSAVGGEASEKEFHIEYVLANLRLARLVNYGEAQKVAHHGQPDYILYDTAKTPRVAIEYKATHNLLLPMGADNVVIRFANGRLGLPHEQSEEQKRDREHVCDSLGQLFRYMVANGLRYGALSSASRTYFCYFEDSADGEVASDIFVSDAWFVGQEGYLRAWAYLWDLSMTDARPYNGEDVKWNVSDPEYHPEDDEGEESTEDDDDSPSAGAPEQRTKRSRGGGSSRSQKVFRTGPSGGGKTHASNEVSRPYLRSPHIPIVPFRSIEFLEPLGFGRNGCVYRANWERKSVAVKQFDLGRRGVMQRFLKEKSAYEMLLDVQGILIPKALFLAESRAGIVYLGLQLGRKPRAEEDISGLKKVLEDLSQRGFSQHDYGTKNCVFIPVPGGGCKETLAVVDLEE